MRPTESHERHGREAYLEGSAAADCPLSGTTLGGVSWRIGWLKAALAEPLADDPDLDEAKDAHAAALAELMVRRRNLLARARRALPTATAAARAIGVPTAAWPGNCHAIASKLLDSGALDRLTTEHGHARCVYGIYLGEIASGTHFAGRAFVHHGWIEFESGLVVDPTRWVFEGTKPAVAATTMEDYDLAGRRTRQALSWRPLPPLDETARIFSWRCADEDATEAVAALLGHGKDWDGRIGLAQMGWLGNLPLERLGAHAKSIYDFFEREGVIALVPIDNRTWVDDAAPAAPGI